MGPVKFNKENVNKLTRGMKGVYGIYDAEFPNGTAYLGMSESCIRERLLAHLEPNNRNGSKTIHMLVEHNHDLWFSYEETYNPRLQEAEEIFRLQKPPANRRYEWKPLREEWGSL
ncbi:hypothetical protein QUB63_01260 [Microcoleus sp. ARI1-B5]|uniref:hypothetical protein n=1 Tax=unclassified Microcoleus TaxID=2642155 RepID=UPI002FD69B8E